MTAADIARALGGACRSGAAMPADPVRSDALRWLRALVRLLPVAARRGEVGALLRLAWRDVIGRVS